MRLSLMLFSLLLALWACGPETNTTAQPPAAGYTITGTVTNPKPGYVVLERFTDQGPLQAVDSVQLDKANCFKLTGPIEGPGYYRLRFFNTLSVLLILNAKDQIELTADASSPTGAYSVKGSRDVEYLEQTNALRNDMQGKARELEAAFMEAQQKGDAATQKRLQGEYMELAAAAGAKGKALLRKMKPSLAAFYTLEVLKSLQAFDPEAEFGLLDTLAQGFKRANFKSTQVDQFIASVEKGRRLAVGQPAPDFSLNTPAGTPVSLSSLLGKYVLVDFWASWCGPCRQENPNVVRMYEKFKTRNFEILGVSLDKDRGKWLGAIEKDGLTWQHVSDLKYWQSEAAQLYQVTGIPATYLIGPDGRIVAKNLRGDALEAKLEQLLLP